jgi:hypothetical protein
MLSLELKDKVLQYVDSKISLEQLEDWLVPRLPIFLRTPETADADVVAAIELGLAEISNETKTELEFRSLLRKALQGQTAVLVYPPQVRQTESTATAQTVRHSFSKTESVFIMTNN